MKDCWCTSAKVCDGEEIGEFVCLCHSKENLHVPEGNNESSVQYQREGLLCIF